VNLGLQKISLQSVSKSFGANQVLKQFSAEIPLEGITFLVGKSGSGKSVLSKLMVGLLKPDAGEIFFNGQPTHLLSEDQLEPIRMGAPYIFQSSGLIDWLTIEKNVELAARIKGTMGQVDSSIERVGLGEFRSRFPPEVSPAVRKRAAIARALVLQPQYILLDEPTTGMDRKAADQVNETIASLRSQGLGALVVSHDYRALKILADQVVEVKEGLPGYVGDAPGFLASIK